MIRALVILSFGCASCAWGANDYDCPAKAPSKSIYQRLEAAAKAAGVFPSARDSIDYCRQRGDGTQFAKWEMTPEIRPDGTEGWKRVACVDEQWTTEGWSCHVTELRAIRVTWGHSYPNNPVTLPMDLALDRAIGLTVEGIAAFERLGRDDGCRFNIHAGAEFRNFSEQALRPGEWRLEAADKPGEFRLVNDPYYVQFGEPAEAGNAKKPRACWASYEYLE
jgi:hypothetical protein